ncbi:hypothetical protein FDH38_gp017 [Dinoroseobacter phage vB_DshS-R5C]|uniref:Uncharacterized protein n=1 Tax=Dinoroseobacter phage vB_DshS-R5C TaxID=1965368 RepID=A0A1V0DY49_9CAUD|nr:hypothetical protein FDH38_gp017 [Dinoroseobacter phage vB_DshS-R5C]ARB06071.1 hypothetical protein vBDshSR5C_17 [Dinoroseobacter phage vB_DshS-R5C]
MTDIDPNDLLLRRSIKWRVAAGWVMVIILVWRYLIHPGASTLLVFNGGDPLPELPPIEWTDVLAIIGLPVGGAFADRMTDD